MIASRLLSILLRLQMGPVTARMLAEEFEVSTRTIYRDVDQLAYAGIPIYCERGREGGIRLDKSWSNRSFGLTPTEIEALLAANDQDLLADLGLDLPVTDAQRKLLLTLPGSVREKPIDRTRRILIDPLPWYRRRDRPIHLTSVARAVWEQQQLAITYTSWKRQVARVVEPLGVVLKAGIWYLVASSENSIRTYRIGEISDARLTEQQSNRPESFDLAAHWQHSIEKFELSLNNRTAHILITTEGIKRLDRLGMHVVLAARESLGEPDTLGWMTARIPIESVEHATIELLTLGRHVQVQSPEDLRAALQDEIRAMLDAD